MPLLTLGVTRRLDETHEDGLSDTYGMASFPLGLVVNDHVTIRPGLTVPFGLVPADSFHWHVTPFGREELEISLGIILGVAFGRRRAAGKGPVPADADTAAAPGPPLTPP